MTVPTRVSTGLMLSEGIKTLLDECVKQGAISAEHVANTPQRYIKALGEMFSGVGKQPEDALSTLFPSDGCDEMIHIKEITFYSCCAHHLVAFYGTMSFAYLPDERIVGLSKIPRLVEVYAKRPQVQEKLTSDIVDAFQNIVKPKGCALMVRAFHLCCMSRGIKQPTSYTETTALRGIFKSPSVKEEFLQSCNAAKWSVQR